MLTASILTSLSAWAELQSTFKATFIVLVVSLDVNPDGQQGGAQPVNLNNYNISYDPN